MGHTEASGIRVWGLALHGIQGFRVQGLGYWVRGSEKRGSLYPKLCLGVGFRFFSHAFGWVSELGSGFGPQAIGLLRFLLRRGVYLGCRRGLGMQTVRECWIFLYSELFDVFSCGIGLGVFEVRAGKGL